MTTLKIGDLAPDFKIGEIALSAYKGKKVVLYFYPKDNTPGCTAESCDLRDNYEFLKSKGYEVIGVSPDSEKSHTNFTSKFGLPFPLVADSEKEVLQAYGVWGEKKNYGKTYFGVIRTTFIIDENGVIEDIITKVDTKAHTKQIIK